MILFNNKMNVLVGLLMVGCVENVHSIATQVELQSGPEAFFVEMNFGPTTSQSTANCIIDTGSANLAVAASNNPQFADLQSITYNQDTPNNACGKDTGEAVSINYVNGSWAGKLACQNAGFANAAVGVNEFAEFVAISSSKNFFNCLDSPRCVKWSCILGMAYQGVAMPSTAPAEPFFGSLVDSGYQNVFALRLCHYSDEYTLGGGTMYLWGQNQIVDSSEFSPQVLYTPILKLNNENTYYLVKVISLMVGTTELGLSCSELNTPGNALVDTGTTGISVPSHVRDAIVNVLTPRLVHDQGPLGSMTASEIETNMFNGVCFPSEFDPHTINASKAFDITFKFPVNGDDTKMFGVTMPPYKYISICYMPNGDRGIRFNLQQSSCDVPTGITLGLAALSDVSLVFDRKHSRLGFGDPIDAAKCNSFRGLLISGTEGSGNYPKKVCTPLGNDYGCAGDLTQGIPTAELGLILGCTVLGILLLGILSYLIPKELASSRKQKKRSYRYQKMNPLQSKLIDQDNDETSLEMKQLDGVTESQRGEGFE